MNATPKSVSALLDRAAEPEFTAWRRNIVRLGGCTNPVHLVGEADFIDAVNGEVLRSYGSTVYGGRLLVACGNRRASVCPTCAKVYRADTYQLIRAGLVGGKSTPVDGRRAPSGVRHADGPRVRARAYPAGAGWPGEGLPTATGGVSPARTASRSGAGERHGMDDPRLGEPLCPRCYDYAGAVLWQAYAGRLWHRFTIELRRELARRVGIERTELAESSGSRTPRLRSTSGAG